MGEAGHRAGDHRGGDVSKLSTHVLDTMHGKPAAGVRCALFRLEGTDRAFLTEASTNADGRCDRPLLEGDALTRGVYELEFAIGDYFAGLGVGGAEPRFLDRVVIRFGVADAGQNYHVPLVVTPWAYQTYRGS